VTRVVKVKLTLRSTMSPLDASHNRWEKFPGPTVQFASHMRLFVKTSLQVIHNVPKDVHLSTGAGETFKRN
jgi:hypothetical protein